MRDPSILKRYEDEYRVADILKKKKRLKNQVLDRSFAGKNSFDAYFHRRQLHYRAHFSIDGEIDERDTKYGKVTKRMGDGSRRDTIR